MAKGTFRVMARRRLRLPDTEVAVWSGGLAYLALLDPGADSLWSLCLLRWAGIHYCPGCGLGRSISYLLHGDVALSLYTHPLGIVALPALVGRIVRLLRLQWSTQSNVACATERERYRGQRDAAAPRP